MDHTAALGGGEIALLNFVSRLDRSQFDPLVILFSDGPLRRKLVEAGVAVSLVPLHPSINNVRKDTLRGKTLFRIPQILSAIGFAVRLSNMLRDENIDLVHTNSLKSDVLGGLAGRLARIPVIWHIRDRIDADYLPKTAVRAFRFLARFIPIQVVANSAATLETIRLPNDRRRTTVYSGITLSASARVVHDGTDANRHEVDIPISSNESRIVGLVGRITRWKGQHIFIRAAAEVLKQFPKTRFQIIGSALFDEHAYDQEIHQLVDSLGIGNSVEFLGFRSDISSVISGLQIVVHASTSGEPFGQVIVEGMAAGKPVVATNGGGVPEIVVDGVTGLLVPMGDSIAMAQAICRLLEDPDLSRKMGLAGLCRAQEYFSIDETVRKIERIYHSLMCHRCETRISNLA